MPPPATSPPPTLGTYVVTDALPGVEALAMRHQREAFPAHFHEGFVFTRVLKGVTTEWGRGPAPESWK